MDFNFHVTASFKNNACEDLDVVIPMSGADKHEAENKVIDHIVNTYENDYLDVETVQIHLIKKEKKR